MLGSSKKIKLSAALWERAQAAAKQAGYSGAEEFVIHAVEKALRELDEGGDESAVRDKLKGLGYF